MLAKEKKELSKLQIWILGIRPRTLPAATAPVLVGTGVAIAEGVFSFLPALAALLGALFIQMGANLANDVFDFKKGTDTEERTGPLRVTQAGLLSPKEVTIGMWVTFLLASIAGIYLIKVGGLPILIIGILSIICAIIYTGGPYPLGYNGLGDIFVFIFFGLVAVCGTYYVQALTLSPGIWWAAVPIGLLGDAILVVNNFRDIATDRKTGKKTLAVRIGERNTQIHYVLLLSISFLIPVLMLINGIASYSILLTFLALPMAISLMKDIFHKKGRELNKTLAKTAKLEIIYAFLFSIGYILSNI